MIFEAIEGTCGFHALNAQVGCGARRVLSAPTPTCSHSSHFMHACMHARSRNYTHDFAPVIRTRPLMHTCANMRARHRAHELAHTVRHRSDIQSDLCLPPGWCRQVKMHMRDWFIETGEALAEEMERAGKQLCVYCHIVDCSACLPLVQC